MIAPFTDMMPQVATYWAPLGNDGYGGTLFDVGILVMCRWQLKNQLVRSNEGQEVTSDTTVYVDRALDPKGYIVLGDETGSSPSAVSDARQIITVGASPSLDGDQQLNVVYL